MSPNIFISRCNYEANCYARAGLLSESQLDLAPPGPGPTRDYGLVFLSRMCGRTACTLDPEEVSRASRYRTRDRQNLRPRWRDGDADKYRPSYNKSPQSCSPVLLSHRHFDKVPPPSQNLPEPPSGPTGPVGPALAVW